MSSGSKARMPSDRHGPKGGGSACSTEEAGQCPQREGAEQDSLLDEGYTAAPEAEPTVATKLAELASSSAIMRRVAESGGELEPDFGGAAQAPVAQKSGSATVPGGAP